MAGEEISSRSVRQKRGCEEMRVHFITASFCALRKGGFKSIIGKGTLAAGGFLVTSFRAKSRNLPCPTVIHVSVKMKIDVFVFRFPAVSRRPFMGLPERSLGCARDDETGSGWFLPSFQISAIHPLPSVWPSSTSSQRGEMPEGLRRAFFSYRQLSPRGEGCDTRIPSSKKRRRSRHLNPEP